MRLSTGSGEAQIARLHEKRRRLTSGGGFLADPRAAVTGRAFGRRPGRDRFRPVSPSTTTEAMDLLRDLDGAFEAVAADGNARLARSAP
jgi:hypothetical protein